MTFQWPQQAFDDLPRGVQACRAVLEDWFHAMEDGTVASRMPDPFYPVSIAQESADKIVEIIDNEFNRELRSWAYQEVAGGFTHVPGFQRLGPEQRVALAQVLHHILKVDKKTSDVQPTPRPGWNIL